MSVPAWLLDIFAAVMLLVAAVSAARLALGRRDRDADIDVSHLLMGVAMAGTLVAGLSTLPPAAWEVIFALLTAWFGYRVAREYRGGHGLRALVSEHHAPHLLHSAAMLYMFLALRPPTPSPGASGAMAMGAAGLRLPTLALLFAFLLAAYVVADLDRIPAPRALTSPALVPTPALAPATSLLVPAPSVASPAPASSVASPAPASSVASPAPASSAVTPSPATTATVAPVPSAATSTPAISPTPGPTADPALITRILSPGVARGCRIAMGVTMAFMLIIMI